MDKQTVVKNKLIAVKLTMLTDYPFYGLLLDKIPIRVDATVPTARTDGRSITFGLDFAYRLSHQEIVFVLLHEILHVVLKHLDRMPERADNLAWNIACDLVINSVIAKSHNNSIPIMIDGAEAMHLCPDGQEGREYTAEEIFDTFYASQKKRRKNSGGSSGGSNGKGKDDEGSSDDSSKDSSNDSSTGRKSSDKTANKSGDRSGDQAGDADSSGEGDGKSSDKGSGGGKSGDDSGDGTGSGEGGGRDDGEKGSAGKGHNGANVDGNPSSGEGAGGCKTSGGGGSGGSSGGGKSSGSSSSGDGDVDGSAGDLGGLGKVTGSAIDDHSGWKKIDRNTEEQWNQSVVDAVKNIQNRYRDDPERMRGRGLIPGEVESLVREILKPKKDWRQLLAEFIQTEVNDYSFVRPDSHYAETDFILPSFSDEEEHVKNIHFWIDTSGSMSDNEITEVFSEVVGAVNQFDGKLQGKLGFFDAQTYPMIDFEGVEDILRAKPVGRGGTNFMPIFHYIAENCYDNPPCAIIIMTDGFAPYGEEKVAMDIPVMWLINNSRAEPTWGRVVRLNDNTES